MNSNQDRAEKKEIKGWTLDASIFNFVTYIVIKQLFRFSFMQARGALLRIKPRILNSIHIKDHEFKSGSSWEKKEIKGWTLDASIFLFVTLIGGWVVRCPNWLELETWNLKLETWNLELGTWLAVWWWDQLLRGINHCGKALKVNQRKWNCNGWTQHPESDYQM